MPVIELTVSGERVAEDGHAVDAKGSVLAVLYEEGPQDLSDIAEALGTSERKAGMVINKLLSMGHVRVRGEGG